MTEANTNLRVTVAPGTGRITRRAGSLLFDPSGENTELIAGFDEADSDEAAIVAVKQHLIDSGFEASPIVIIDWRSEGLALLVFGDVSVQTSAAAAANISGAGSGTWIERHLGALELGDADKVDVWCGDETDDATDLQLGHVRGGGVRVALTRVVRRPPPPAEPESLNPRPVPSPAPAPAASPPPSAATPAAATPAANGSSAPAPAPSVDAGFVAPMPASDWAAAESQPAAGAVAVAPDPFVEPVAPNSADEAVTDPLAQTSTIADAANLAADSGAEPAAGLVEATLCSNLHSNPPRYSICRVCAVEISPATAVTLVAQPSVGHLRFDDGAVVEVSGSLVIGRKPTAEAGETPVVVDHAEVSRSHVGVTIDGWSVLVTDRGSRNGTWVIPTSDPTPIKLDAQVPYLLEHGTTVHLGGPEASFAYDFGTD